MWVLAMQGNCAYQGSLLRSWLCGQRAGHATVAVKHVFSSSQGGWSDYVLPEMKNLLGRVLELFCSESNFHLGDRLFVCDSILNLPNCESSGCS